MQSPSLRDLNLSSEGLKKLLNYLHETEVLRVMKTCPKIDY